MRPSKFIPRIYFRGYTEKERREKRAGERKREGGGEERERELYKTEREIVENGSAVDEETVSPGDVEIYVSRLTKLLDANHAHPAAVAVIVAVDVVPVVAFRLGENALSRALKLPFPSFSLNANDTIR